MKKKTNGSKQPKEVKTESYRHEEALKGIDDRGNALLAEQTLEGK